MGSDPGLQGSDPIGPHTPSYDQQVVDDISAAAARLREGKTTAVALTAASLAAIDQANGRLNAFISVDGDGARAAAARADAELAAGLDRGPLHGIPISIKDLINEAGRVTTAAAHVLDDRRADHDATVVTRLRDAGAVIVGRTNLHQFALGTTSEDSAFGPVRHPMDPSRSPGGSSGGSAVAVATRMGLASIGTDTGGSIRIPSAICGLVGLKATTGEIPTEGVLPLSPTLDHVGPLALSVRDAASIYQVLSGLPHASVAPVSLSEVRLTRLAGYFSGPLEFEVRAAFTSALDQLRRAGGSIDSGEIASSREIATAYVSIVLPEAAEWHAPYLDTRADGYVASVRERIMAGRAVSAVEYLSAQRLRMQLREQVDALLGSCDALVLPTLPIVAPTMGLAEVIPDPEEGASLTVRAAMLKHTQLFNLTGHPAVTLPLSTPGLPVGLQLVGRRHQTARLLAIAQACETAFGKITTKTQRS